ncbi:MAG: hemerythrin domain-containing protein [Elusimicrobia bacterium]|nr:hemerythrin domain-containing protein [Elusimicrobiota bacterium]
MTPRTPRRPPTLADVAQARAEHGQLKELMRRHQESLIGFELSNALGELEEFARRLRRHIRLEEDVLLPVYAGLGPFPRGSGAETFLTEHRRIEALTAEVLAAARGLSVGSASRGGVVSLIEREAALKAFLARHERREELSLLARVERRLEGL